MLHFLRDRRSAVLLMVVAASLFVLMAVQVHQSGPVGSEGFLLRLASPLLRGAAAVTGSLSGVWNDYVDLRGTRRRNESLEDEVTRLRLELQKLEEARLQNDRLRTLLDLKDGMGVPSVAAAVISNNSLGLTHTLLLDRGELSGLRPNMPVVSSMGVVGRVWTVSPRVAKVQLITDAQAGTAVLVQRTRVQAILVGTGSDTCSLQYVSTLEEIAEGDLLVTSGQDGIYPKGLPVGVVSRLGQGRGILRSIAVTPRADFRKLEEVLVMLRGDIPLPEAPAPPAASAAPQGASAGDPR
ncbi:MAG TPA: rod shape-determining protein MreC [Candidatus Polarisedimenticolia bacterium]|nr:rod shape-determining protein MreC [Candidatus Polarisedimenticolia bacterium]